MRLRRRSYMKWLCAAAAPWALGAGMLVSFTAAAGHDPQAGISAAAWSYGAPLIDPGALVPPSDVLARASLRLPALDLDGVVRETRLRADLPEEASHLGASLPLRPEMKGSAPDYPAIDRAAKGNPLLVPRPTLSRRAGELARGASAARLLFGTDERVLPPTVLMPGPIQSIDPDAMATLEPWQGEEATTTQHATSVQSPTAAAAGSTGPAREARASSRGGSSPAVARAMALSSATPAPADAVPIEIAAAPVALPQAAALVRPEILGPGMTAVPRDELNRPRYADLVNPDTINREQRCLAEAVYFEARSEPEAGQAAVAQVILNRAQSGLYPSSICGVVYQNRHRHLACQFTFACEGKALRVTDDDSWERAKRVATEVLDGKTYLADVGGATHYHADYVRPRWAKRLKKMDVIGRHIFYKLRPGQT